MSRAPRANRAANSSADHPTTAATPGNGAPTASAPPADVDLSVLPPGANENAAPPDQPSAPAAEPTAPPVAKDQPAAPPPPPPPATPAAIAPDPKIKARRECQAIEKKLVAKRKAVEDLHAHARGEKERLDRELAQAEQELRDLAREHNAARDAAGIA